MSRQYEPCEHRPERVVMGVHEEAFDTPCAKCEAAKKAEKYGNVVGALMVVVILSIIALAAWKFGKTAYIATTVVLFLVSSGMSFQEKDRGPTVIITIALACWGLWTVLS